ncbi:MAG: tRNA (cytidine(34)-2'-O)-methyltransferase [Deltaproteobacteria bacterium]|nr:tRNA (cytidine(34)-2'-O)-methyltransferase [Deltaproteobacteria bacterium]
MAQNTPFHIVLIEPEIPPNTGNIGRLCAATGTHLHLVGKLGFSLDDKHLRRAGLDYWPEVNLHRWESLEQLQKAHPQAQFWYTSKKATQTYTSCAFSAGDFFVFGKETLGLPEELLDLEADRTLRIPIFSSAVRSLNLANSAAIILYEALRQTEQL